jgi:hypothetical protein
MNNREIIYKCHYCENFAITTKIDSNIVYNICKIHDNRSLDEVEDYMNKMFERQRDFE